MKGEQKETKLAKKWWAPVWNGLVMDPDAVHFERIGNALWLFLYLVLNANRSTGVLVRKVKTISTDTGIGRRKIFEWLGILRAGKYIFTKSSGRCLAITIQKWKPIGAVPDSAHQKCRIPHLRGAENRTPQTLPEARTLAPVKEESAPDRAPKKNILKKNNLKNDIDNENFDFENLEPIRFKTREELLAHDLAKALDDLSGFPLYLTLARKYPESLLRETLGKVREIPGGKIKTSRGALFNFLVQRNAIRSTFNPRH